MGEFASGKNLPNEPNPMFPTPILFLGPTDDEKRRVGVRRYPVGDPHAVHSATVRGTDQRTGGGELQPLVPERWLSALPSEATGVSARDLRSDGRVLEAQRLRQA